MNAEDHLEKWVNLSSQDTGPDSAVLAELDVDIESKVRQFNSAQDINEWSYSVDPTYDGPYDLLWFGAGKYRIVPRPEWRPRARFPP